MFISIEESDLIKWKPSNDDVTNEIMTPRYECFQDTPGKTGILGNIYKTQMHEYVLLRNEGAYNRHAAIHLRNSIAPVLGPRIIALSASPYALDFKGISGTFVDMPPTYHIYEKLAPGQYVKLFYDIDVETNEHLFQMFIDTINVRIITPTTAWLHRHISPCIEEPDVWQSHKYVDGKPVKISLHIIWQVAMRYDELKTLFGLIYDAIGAGSLNRSFIDKQAINNGLRVAYCSKLSDPDRRKLPLNPHQPNGFLRSLLTYWPGAYICKFGGGIPSKISPIDAQTHTFDHRPINAALALFGGGLTIDKCNGPFLHIRATDRHECPICKRTHEQLGNLYITFYAAKYWMRCHRSSNGKRFLCEDVNTRVSIPIRTCPDLLVSKPKPKPVGFTCYDEGEDCTGFLLKKYGGYKILGFSGICLNIQLDTCYICNDLNRVHNRDLGTFIMENYHKTGKRLFMFCKSSPGYKTLLTNRKMPVIQYKRV